MQVKIIGAVLISILLAGFLSGVLWSKRNQALTEAAQSVADAKEEVRTEKVKVKVVTEYIDRVVEIKVKGDEIIKKVPVYVPSDDCVVTPDAVRVLNAAASKTLQLSGAATRADDPAGAVEGDLIPCATLARAVTVVAENYLQYHRLSAQLEALQAFIRETGKPQR